MNNPKYVPFITHEYAQSRLERIIKRLWITTIILIVLLVGTNVAWLIYESSFEYFETSIEAEQDGEGVNIVGGGDVTYGAESEGNN
jgi:hypothetical protein